MADARIVVNLDLPEAKISRHLYGHFAEHLGRCIYGGFWVGEDSPIPHTRGIRDDVVAALRALGIPNLRWPGGCFADEYHWRDGVGPREGRPSMVNTSWGGVVEDNSFGTHEFFDLCELLGAEPYVNGNVGSGTVAEMSDWVSYITAPGGPLALERRRNGRDEPWRVTYWGIGNEPWGCGGHMTAAQYADEARRYATYLRDQGDNKLYRIAAGANDWDLTWTRTLMEALTDLGPGAPRRTFQAITLHAYSVIGDWDAKVRARDLGLEEYRGVLAKAQEIERMVRAHATVMDAYDPDCTVGLILDEWGTWWASEEGTNPAFLHQQNTMTDALVAAVHLDGFHRQAGRLVMANLAQTVNVLQAVLLTDEATGALIRTPTYHVFEMNKGHQDADALVTRVVGGPAPQEALGRPLELVSASASRTGDSALVSLSNLDAEEPLTVTLDLRGGDVAELSGRLLAASDRLAHNTAEHPDAVAPVALDLAADGGAVTCTLPPASFATVSVRLA